jgi:hypothetical protein
MTVAEEKCPEKDVFNDSDEPLIVIIEGIF